VNQNIELSEANREDIKRTKAKLGNSLKKLENEVMDGRK
jgi:hypothetical protein